MRQTCLNMVYDLAKRDKRVLFIGSDLSPGLLADMKKEMPERWYMEGITEANVIGMAAGFDVHHAPLLRAGGGRSLSA